MVPWLFCFVRNPTTIKKNVFFGLRLVNLDCSFVWKKTELSAIVVENRVWAT